MVTKKYQSNKVTRLKVSRNVFTEITNKTAGKYAPRKDEYYIRDKKLAGFWIRVAPKGRKVYGCYGKLFGVGKEARVTIGTTELYSANQARKLATKHLQDIKAGIDPKSVAKTEAQKTSSTIESLMEMYLETKIQQHKPAYQHDFEYRLRQNFSALLTKDVRELTTADLIKWWNTKQGTKDPKGSKIVVLRYLSPLLNLAKALDLIDKNVAHSFKQIIADHQESPPRKRHIKKSKMENWILSFLAQAVPHSQYKLKDGSWKTKAVDNYPALWNSNPVIGETQRDYLLFLLLTGKRKDEAAEITWQDLDWDEDLPTITIQPATVKASKQDIIPMSHVVAAMLDFRKNRPDKHEKWVFENKFGSGPITDCRKSLEKICHYTSKYHSIDLPETINLHDLRRTHATMAEETGIDRKDIKRSLSHSIGDVTDRYITRSLEQMRRKREQIEKEILQNNKWYILVNWYGCHQDLMSNWEPDLPDLRPKAGYLEILKLPLEAQDEYRFE